MSVSMRVLVAVLLLLSIPRSLQAALGPGEIAILASRGSKSSKELAEYYADARHVPRANICLVELPAGEFLSREEWEARVRPAIRTWLSANQLDKKIRCFVTVFDVPLRIGPVDAAQPAI